MTTSTRTTRRDRYLDVALDLFISRGFSATTMDMIVERVGGSKATLYRHFPSKDALVDGLTDRIADVLDETDPLEEIVDLPLEEGLRRFGATVGPLTTSPQVIDMLRLALGEYHRFPQLAHILWKNGPAITYRNFRIFYEHKRARGELIAADPQIAAEQFIAGLVGHQQLKVAMGMGNPLGASEAEARVESAIETFLARYRQR